MASIAQLHALIPGNSIKKSSPTIARTTFLGSTISSRPSIQKTRERKQLTVVAAAGDVSADGTIYLIAGAAAVALVGTAFPIFFSRKDTCPECDGAGFVRKAGATLRANAARKDEAQIVCARCNGLGKLNQIDK
ncbi:transmembrane protein [Perilla frutescens var. hirtella]|nr:transmembrane protein [Perilla frutescens var. hirtella]KAH6806219.1 transmembrane protein [Perilla frutescens var. frutescens]